MHDDDVITVPTDLLRGLIGTAFDFDNQPPRVSFRAQAFRLMCQQAPGVARSIVDDAVLAGLDYWAWDLIDQAFPLPELVDHLTTAYLTGLHHRLGEALRAEGVPTPADGFDGRDEHVHDGGVTVRPTLSVVREPEGS